MSNVYGIITKLDSNVCQTIIRTDKISAIVCRNNMIYDYIHKKDININEKELSEEQLSSTDMIWIENGNEFVEWYIFECVISNEKINLDENNVFDFIKESPEIEKNFFAIELAHLINKSIKNGTAKKEDRNKIYRICSDLIHSKLINDLKSETIVRIVGSKLKKNAEDFIVLVKKT